MSARVQALLDVEVALCEAQAEVGVVHRAAAAEIRKAARVERFDLDDLQREAEIAGNIVIPLVRRLTDLVAAESPEAAEYVHVGATSQDILDTATLLQLRRSATMLDGDLRRAMRGAAALARSHAATPMAGRTWLQQASPVTLGLKAAGWLDAIARCRQRASEAVECAMVIQLGGASGTLAAFAPSGLAVAEAFARQLSLATPDLPWHTHRDRLAHVASTLAIVCGTLGKLGRDLTLLAQTEVGEVVETPSAGRGGSSSMPHKRNPVLSVRMVAAATQAPGLAATLLAAMPQEHERAAGGWQAEWETLPALVRLAMDAARAAGDALERLTIDAIRMRENLGAMGGAALSEALAVALAARLPRRQAVALVERLSRAVTHAGPSLAELATADEEVSRHLSAAEIAQALDPANALGAAPSLIERVLRRWHDDLQ